MPGDSPNAPQPIDRVTSSSRSLSWSPSPSLIAALAAILLVAAFLRFVHIGQPPMWFDEAWHVELSNGRGSAHMRLDLNRWLEPEASLTELATAAPVWRVPLHMDWVIHPPGYHIALRLWREVLGEAKTDAVGTRAARVRALSAMLSLVGVFLTYLLARELTVKAPCALCAAAICAVSPAQVGQSQDARGYPMLMVLLLLTCLAVVRLARPGRSLKPGACLPFQVCIGALGMVFTHYFAAGACVALFVFGLLRLRGAARVRVAVGLVVAAGVYLVLWGPTLRAQLAHVPDTADIFLLDDAPGAMLRSLARLASLPARLLIDVPERASSMATLSRYWQWSAVPVGLVIAGLLVAAARRHRQMLITVLVVGFTAAELFALDVARGTRHLEYIRYSFLASPLLYVALGTFCSPTDRARPTQLALLLVVLACVVMLPFAYRRDNPNYRPMATALIGPDRSADPRDPLIVLAARPDGRDAQAMLLCLDFDEPQLLAGRAVAIASASMPGELARSVAALLRSSPTGPQGTVWVVAPDRETAARANLSLGDVLEARVFPAGACARVRPGASPASFPTAP